MSDDVRELHYVVKYTIETKMWEIDWDSMEARFDEGKVKCDACGWVSSKDGSY